MKKVLGLCLCLLASPLFAQSLLLQGKVGGSEVVMTLEIGKDREVSGRYFYRKYLQDIALDGQLATDGSLVLGENLPYDTTRSDFRLKADGKGWRGEWRGPKAKQAVSVSLQPYQPAEWPRSEDAARSTMRQSDPYNYVRLAAMQLKPGKRETVQGRGLQWWQEPVSKVTFFRLEAGYPDAVSERLNQQLAMAQWQSVAAYFDCIAGGARSAGADYEVSVTPGLLGAQLFSTRIQTAYFCGGAHPDFEDSSLNLDVASGRELALEDILWLGKKPAGPLRNDKGELLDPQYSTAVFNPWLLRTLQQLHPAEFAEDSGDEGCDYHDPGVWHDSGWRLTPKGIVFGAYFPRVARVCDNPDWSVIPWAVVKRHPGLKPYSLP